MSAYLTRSFVLLLSVCSVSATLRAQTPGDSIKYHYPPLTILGTRYAEHWIQVPFSLSFVQQKDLPKGKGYGGIPGVLAPSRAGSTDIRITIRGFGARGAGARSDAGTSRGVRILTDGFPETEPDGRTSFDLIDISGAGGIGVIRSNASSLYGNASGLGLNNLTDKRYIGSAWLNPDLVGGKPLFIEPGLPQNFIGSIGLGVNL